MELLKEILVKALENEKVRVEIPGLQADLKDIVELKAYDALKKIKAVIDDSTVDDKECIEKTERIIRIFEELGSGTFRHDF